MKKRTALLSLSLLFLALAGPAVAQTPVENSPTTPPTSPTSQATPQPTPTPPPTENFLTVSPPIRELELPRDSANTYQMSITNRSDRTLDLILRASPFVASGETGGVNVADEPLADSQNWIILNPARIRLAPKEKKDISYTITIPPSAEPGGFYFAVTALLSGQTSVSASPEEVATGTSINLNVSSLNLVRIAGPVDFDARIVEFSTDKKFYEYGPVDFTTRILNQSTVHIKPALEVQIRNTLGLEEEQNVKLRLQNILPQATRRYEAQMGGKWHIGRYAANLTGTYGNGRQLNYTIYFWIMPWKIIIAILLALAIIILLITSIKRQLSEKKVLEEELNKMREKTSGASGRA